MQYPLLKSYLNFKMAAGEREIKCLALVSLGSSAAVQSTCP